VLIAANYKSNADVLPHLMLQLVITAAAVHPSGQVYVSVMENDSSDSSPQLLRQLSQVLSALQIPATIVTDAPLRRLPGQPRISYLAQVRNAAMAPVYNATFRYGLSVSYVRRRAGPLLQRSVQARLLARSRPGGPAQRVGPPLTAPPPPATRTHRHRQRVFDPDSILFVNDVYLCAGELLRLLLHDVDVACAMDWVVDEPAALHLYDNWWAVTQRAGAGGGHGGGDSCWADGRCAECMQGLAATRPCSWQRLGPGHRSRGCAGLSWLILC
jgi:hypothetical protein